MLTAHIIYASRTGNNEEVANIIHDCLAKTGVQVNEEIISQSNFDNFVTSDILVICTYTYGQGKLPKEISSFYPTLQKADLRDKIFGVAGSGDKSFGHFFDKAVDYFVKAFRKSGATEGAKEVKIDLEPSEVDIERLNQFAKELVQTASSSLE